jgi:crotonobetainyl-CoA:carnitine CoA-transferase CaiB-like acyl-CoA transferase
MSALYEREHTGRGQFVEASLIETVGAFIGAYGMIAETVLGGQPRYRQGNALIFALGDCLETRNGDFVVFNCIGSMFKRLCDMIGHPELLDDARFATDASRYIHRDLLIPHVATWARSLPTAEILALAERFRLPFEKVGTVADLARDAHAQARQLFPRVSQPELGDIPVARMGVTLSAHPPLTLQPAPTIGEHNERVLADWLEYTPAQIQELRAQGVLPS